MAECTCGFSTEYPTCNGTHKVVQKVREEIARQIEGILYTHENAEGMKMLAANVARGKSIVINAKNCECDKCECE
jgi:hypothetical protein